MQPPQYFESKTEKGLKFLFFGFLIITLFQIFFTGFIYANQDRISDIQTEATEESELSSESLGYLGALCGGQAFMFVGLILILLGLINYYKYRSEFGVEHAGNVNKGLIFLVIGFIISIVGSLGATAQDSNVVIPVSVAVLIITAIFYAIGFLFLLKSVYDKTGMNYLKLGVLLLLIFNIINSILLIVAWKLPDALGGSYNTTLIGYTITQLSNIPWAIFTFSIFRAWKRIQNGWLKPMYLLPPPPIGVPIGSPPPIPGQSTFGTFKHGKKCPSCDYVLSKPTNECPKCGYYFENE